MLANEGAHAAEDSATLLQRAQRSGRSPRSELGKGELLALQRTAGNRAVQRMLADRTAEAGGEIRPAVEAAVVQKPAGQIQRAGPQKPSARWRPLRWNRTKKLEKAVDKGDGAAATKMAAKLNKDAPAYYIRLLAYQLHSSEGNIRMNHGYYLAAPKAARERGFDMAFQGEDADLALAFAPDATELPIAAVYRAATEHAAFFIKHGLQAMKKKHEVRLMTLLEDQMLLKLLKQGAPGPYRRFAETTPLLKIASAVEEKGLTGKREIVDAIFKAFVSNEGITVSYVSGRIIFSTAGLLVGKYAKPEKPDDIMFPRAQCHDLAAMLTKVLRAYPELDVKIESQDEEQPVLTRPLNQMTRSTGLTEGLIKNNFRGNVFTAGGAETGQIFFAGLPGEKTHTWLKVGGREYDPVFGTDGPERTAVAAGTYERTGHTDIFRRGGAYLVRDRRRQAPESIYGFGTGYTLVENPRRWVQGLSQPDAVALGHIVNWFRQQKLIPS